MIARGGKLHAYVVNLDAKRPVSTRLLVWAGTWDMAKVDNVYTGKTMAVERDEEGYLSIPLMLGPGGGALLATDARRK